MTQQLQLAIKLLALTNVELETYIGEELDKNPLLSTSDGADTAEAPIAPEAAIDPSRQGLDSLLGKSGEGSGGDAPLDVDYTGEAFHHDTPGDSADWGAPASSGSGEDVDFDSFAADDASLADVLTTQASAAFDGAELIIARHIIDLIDEAGYLGESTDDIAERLGIEVAAVEAVLARIHGFDPVGVGARSLSECLAIQAREADRYRSGHGGVDRQSGTGGARRHQRAGARLRSRPRRYCRHDPRTALL